MPRATVESGSEDGDGPRPSTRRNGVKKEVVKKEKMKRAAAAKQNGGNDEDMYADEGPSREQQTRSNGRVRHQTREDDENDEEEDEGSSRGNKRQRVNGAGDSRSTGSPEASGSGSADAEGARSQAEPLAPHRKTLPRDVDGFIPGSIVRIQLHNFVTYDYVEFRPGPHLNMILGPNGTGKSSIACAIALGLNFPPKVLGRATELNAFVKNNTPNGYIEIELKGPAGKGNLIVKRTLSAKDNKSSFFLNGEPATGQEIKNHMAELNVQVENLCSFLPQDKVSSFAAMTPSQLLVETQKAAGDPNLTAWYETLKEEGEVEKKLKQKRDADVVSCKQAEERNAGIEQDVERFKERKKIESEIAYLDVAHAVVIYRERKVAYNAMKLQRKKLAAKVKRLQDKNAPAHQKLRDYEKGEDRAKRAREEKKAQLTACTKEMQRRYDRSEELDKEAQDITDKLSEVKKAEKQRQANIKNKEADIIKLQELLEKDPPKIEPEDELAEQLKSVKLDISGIKTEFNEKNEELMAAIARKNGALHQISRIEQDKKLAMLQKWDPDSYAAVVWLRQNRNLFEQEIFEPPIISCAVKSSEFAPFVEAFFNGSQMKMFVAQSKRDLDVLNKHINDNPVNGRKLRIATWYKQCSDESFAPPPMTRDQMAELGFDGYALDYLEYPSGMEYYLKDMNLHRNAICRKPNLDVARAMELVGHSGGAWFTNGRTMNQVSKSRYGKRAVGNMTRDIQDAKSFVHPPVDTAAQQKYQDEINGYRLEIEAAEEKKSELVPLIEAISARDKERKAAFDAIKAKQRKHQEFKAELTKNQRKLTAAKDNLRELQNRPSADEARNRLRAKLLGVCEKRLKLAKECRDAAKTILEKQLQCAKAGFAFLQAETNHAHLKALCEERDAKYHEAAREFDRVNQAFAKMKVEVVGLLDVAKEKAEALDDETEAKERLRKMQSDLAEYDRQVKAAKQNGGPLPDTEGIELRTAAEIEEALGTFRTNLDMIISTNPGVLEEYEKRQRDIERYQITIQETEAKIAASAKKIKSTKDKWLPALQKLVDSIGSRFSHSFEGIGCAGEIRIKEEEDYAKWAIEIYVKFRDTEKLQLLTGQRQSGGERSLTTILYLMSLTEEARAPFSLVDEINQGMDQRAERVVHNSMVRVTCKEDSAQYFLITPKLLTDLKYDARMKILCVNNGEWLPDEKGIGNMMNMIEGYVSHRAGGANAQ